MRSPPEIDMLGIENEVINLSPKEHDATMAFFDHLGDLEKISKQLGSEATKGSSFRQALHRATKKSLFIRQEKRKIDAFQKSLNYRKSFIKKRERQRAFDDEKKEQARLRRQALRSKNESNIIQKVRVRARLDAGVEGDVARTILAKRCAAQRGESDFEQRGFVNATVYFPPLIARIIKHRVVSDATTSSNDLVFEFVPKVKHLNEKCLRPPTSTDPPAAKHCDYVYVPSQTSIDQSLIYYKFDE